MSSNSEVAGADTAQAAIDQQESGSWPKPGDEGYVHPDGTLQSVRQLAANRLAAANRAAAGSIIHGAPAGTSGPQLPQQATAAARRVSDHTGPTLGEAEAGLTDFVRSAADAPATVGVDVNEQGVTTARKSGRKAS